MLLELFQLGEITRDREDINCKLQLQLQLQFHSMTTNIANYSLSQWSIGIEEIRSWPKYNNNKVL